MMVKVKPLKAYMSVADVFPSCPCCNTFRFQEGPSPSYQCIAPSTERLKETSIVPTYQLAEGGLTLTYSRLTLLSTQLGGRPTIVFSGDVSSTRQHSNRGTPLKQVSTSYQSNISLVSVSSVLYEVYSK